MRDIVASFGAWVQSTCEKDPVKARRWLARGYQAKELQIRHDPRLKDSPAARMVAAQTMRAMTLRSQTITDRSRWWPVTCALRAC